MVLVYICHERLSSHTWFVQPLTSLFHPGDVETAGDEGVGVGHLLDDLAGGLAGAVARLGVHQDEERVGLLGAAAHNVLQGGDVLERVQGHNAVVVVASQQQHGGILDAVVVWDADVVERGVPVGVSRGTSGQEQTPRVSLIYLDKYYIFLGLVVCVSLSIWRCPSLKFKP